MLNTGGKKVAITGIERVLAFSTTTPLGAGGGYTSPSIDAISYKACIGYAYSDVAGSYIVQHSDDGLTWTSSSQNATSASTLATVAFAVSARYIRYIFTNGASPQTIFRFSMYLSPL